MNAQQCSGAGHGLDPSAGDAHHAASNPQPGSGPVPVRRGLPCDGFYCGAIECRGTEMSGRRACAVTAIRQEALISGA